MILQVNYSVVLGSFFSNGWVSVKHCLAVRAGECSANGFFAFLAQPGHGSGPVAFRFVFFRQPTFVSSVK